MGSRIALLTAMLALSGCTVSVKQPLTSCELPTTQVCSRAVEAGLREGTIKVENGPRADDAQVVPLVVPVFREDGVLAAEADCYANTDGRTFSMVRAETAIAPSSEKSVEFLRERHLCSEHEQSASASIVASQ